MENVVVAWTCTPLGTVAKLGHFKIYLNNESQGPESWFCCRFMTRTRLLLKPSLCTKEEIILLKQKKWKKRQKDIDTLFDLLPDSMKPKYVHG